MPSTALRNWQSAGLAALDEIEAAHAAMGGLGRGRRYATQQINQAYAVLLSSQFQRFCRDLHTECVDYLTSDPAHSKLNPILSARLTEGRKLDSGNPNAGNIGSDFGRFDVDFWDRVRALDRRNEQRRRRLEELNLWRNAIAHQDFRDRRLGGRTTLRLADVRAWRTTCEFLAVAFDRTMHIYFLSTFGAAPW